MTYSTVSSLLKRGEAIAPPFAAGGAAATPHHSMKAVDRL